MLNPSRVAQVSQSQIPTHSSRSWRSNFESSQVTSVNSMSRVPVAPRTPITPRKMPFCTTETAQHIDGQQVELVDISKPAADDYDEKNGSLA